MEVARRVAALAALTVFLGGCGLMQQWREQAYREYHAARFAEVARAYASPSATAGLSAEVKAPNVCRAGLEPAYRALVAQGWQEELAWRELLGQAGADCVFTQQTVEAVAARDAARATVLAPQIAAAAQAMASERERYAAAQEQTEEALERLRAEWTKVWPANDLDFDLERARAEALRDLPPPAPEQAAALAKYQANEYARLAMIYLDYQPNPLPDPQSPVPPGAGAVSRALIRLEAGLAARCALDEAIGTDVDLVRKLTGAGDGAVDWAALAPPTAKYNAVRFEAALARLKLYKYLDQLATPDLDLLCREVDLAWSRAWPGGRAETNIFAFAGLTEQGQPTPAAQPADSAIDASEEYAEWTFRRSIERWEPPE